MRLGARGEFSGAAAKKKTRSSGVEVVVGAGAFCLAPARAARGVFPL